jgi:hypothetical protein
MQAHVRRSSYLEGRQEGKWTMRGFLFALPAVLAALGLFAATATADQPSSATSTFTATGPPTVTDISTAGPNTFITESVPARYDGEVSGPYLLTGTALIKSDGSVTAHGTLVCTGCTIGGRTGDFSAVTTLSGPSLSDITGRLTITSASGGLAGLHGTSDYAGSAVGGTNTWSYHFDP